MLKELLLWLLISILISSLSQIVLSLYLKKVRGLIISINDILLGGIILLVGFGLWHLFGFSLILIFDLLVVATLLIILRVDEAILIIPDLLNLFILILAIVKMVYNHQIDYYNLVATLVLTSILVLANILYKKKKGIEAIGYGDLKLLLVYALYMSLTSACISLFIASLSAVIVEIIVKKRSRQLFPFGPYLAIGMIIALFLKFI